MTGWIRHLHHRELRFLSLIGLTGAIIALYLSAGLKLAGEEGTGWRAIDLDTLQRRIETGELRDREASWYHSSTPEEVQTSGGRK
jgi:hypothetical protein